MPKRRKREEKTESMDELDHEDQDDTPAEETPLGPTMDPVTPNPTSESPLPSVLPKIPLRVFEKVAGPKWDQLAGFKSYAKAQGLGPMTIPEWREALRAFKNQPTK